MPSQQDDHQAPRDVFVAAQPIFDERSRVFAHELLFRSGPENYFPRDTDEDHATSSVITHGIGMIGLDALTGGTPAFINLPRKLLLDDFAFILPPRGVVIELLETIEPDEEVFAACRRLKQRGYQLALDDFVDAPGFEPLVELADYVKVDLRSTDLAEQARLAELFIPRRIRMLAEKVETQDEVSTTANLGYRYFQGYFFSKPVLVAAKDVPGFKLNYLRLLRELNGDDLDFDEVENIVSQELSMSYRVLRSINSAAFGLRAEITSIRQALIMLGPEQMRRWACVWGLAGLGQDKPAELLISTIRRARACELLGDVAQHVTEPGKELFILGLFSTIDAIIGRPMEEVLSGIAIPEAIRDALLGDANAPRHLLDLVIAAERGDWETCETLVPELGLTEDQISTCQLEAAEFARHAFTS